MGINRTDVELLIHLRQQNYIPLNPYVLELGAQQLSNSLLRSEGLVRQAETLFGAAHPFPLPAPLPSMVSAEGNELQDTLAPFARDFWLSLGFDYAAIDVDGSPGSIPLDLNYDQVPVALQSKYGLVTNLGTTEHVCNQMNAFKVIHDLAAPGGVMIHHLPAGGMLNHGLVNYTPKFFWYLARSNDYKWLYMNFRKSGHHYPIPTNLLDFMAYYDRESSDVLRRDEIVDYSIIIALQKKLDIPFVAPLDVNTGTQTGDANLNRRYWSVFQPSLLEAVRRGERLPEGISQPPTAEADSDREQNILAMMERAISESEDKIRRTLVRIPGRRFVALVAAISALSTAIIMAAIIIGVQWLFF
jgi:hypothetical protein